MNERAKNIWKEAAAAAVAADHVVDTITISHSSLPPSFFLFFFLSFRRSRYNSITMWAPCQMDGWQQKSCGDSSKADDGQTPVSVKTTVEEERLCIRASFYCPISHSFIAFMIRQRLRNGITSSPLTWSSPSAEECCTLTRSPVITFAGKGDKSASKLKKSKQKAGMDNDRVTFRVLPMTKGRDG